MSSHRGHVLVPLRRFQEQAFLRRHAYPEWVPVRHERAGVDARPALDKSLKRRKPTRSAASAGS
jgi:hypothetical protein